MGVSWSRSRAATDHPATPATEKRVICIGDLHGNLTRAKALWTNLVDTIGDQEVSNAEVVFLGDFCDRGPDTKGVIDWLINLQLSRSQYPGRTHFLCGNHDFGMAAFLSCLPCDQELLSLHALDDTKQPHFTQGFWPHPIPGGMHYQGRRWGGSRILFLVECIIRAGDGEDLAFISLPKPSGVTEFMCVMMILILISAKRF